MPQTTKYFMIVEKYCLLMGEAGSHRSGATLIGSKKFYRLHLVSSTDFDQLFIYFFLNTSLNYPEFKISQWHIYLDSFISVPRDYSSLGGVVSLSVLYLSRESIGRWPYLIVSGFQVSAPSLPSTYASIYLTELIVRIESCGYAAKTSQWSLRISLKVPFCLWNVAKLLRAYRQVIT